MIESVSQFTFFLFTVVYQLTRTQNSVLASPAESITQRLLLWPVARVMSVHTTSPQSCRSCLSLGVHQPVSSVSNSQSNLLPSILSSFSFSSLADRVVFPSLSLHPFIHSPLSFQTRWTYSSTVFNYRTIIDRLESIVVVFLHALKKAINELCANVNIHKQPFD